VSEIAEEYGVKEHVNDTEEELMLAKGLLKFSAEEYLSELQGMLADFFPQPDSSPTVDWI
jgi:hypothetical protein